MTDATTCLWCQRPLVTDRDGRWLHTSGGYPCRDRWGVITSSIAEPAPLRLAVHRAEEGWDAA